MQSLKLSQKTIQCLRINTTNPPSGLYQSQRNRKTGLSKSGHLLRIANGAKGINNPHFLETSVIISEFWNFLPLARLILEESWLYSFGLSDDLKQSLLIVDIPCLVKDRIFN